jgi:hypothetical protein
VATLVVTINNIMTKIYNSNWFSDIYLLVTDPDEQSRRESDAKGRRNRQRNWKQGRLSNSIIERKLWGISMPPRGASALKMSGLQLAMALCAVRNARHIIMSHTVAHVIIVSLLRWHSQLHLFSSSRSLMYV